jgi:hypothetical protein
VVLTVVMAYGGAQLAQARAVLAVLVGVDLQCDSSAGVAEDQPSIVGTGIGIGYGVITMATEFWPTLIGLPMVLVAVLIGVTVLGPG